MDMPSDWMDTLEDEPVVTWLEDDDFPFSTSESMIQYLRRHYKKDVGTLIVSDAIMPQSFAHWWCRVRVTRRDGRTTPDYPTLTKWLSIVYEWRGEDTTPNDVFGTFKAWLDILFLDMTIYEDEAARHGVPRQIGDGVQWHGRRRNAKTRLETMRFIVNEGLEIFRERGWSDGYEYWNEECKKYNLFS